MTIRQNLAIRLRLMRFRRYTGYLMNGEEKVGELSDGL
jgi:hypothetical protein